MTTLSQRLAIKKHLESGKQISSLDALRLYGAMRLAARILELKRQGMKIDKFWVRRGEKRFPKYYRAA